MAIYHLRVETLQYEVLRATYLTPIRSAELTERRLRAEA
jgi:hypothetical protein